MLLRDRLQTALKEAMKAKEADRLSTLRLINAAIKDREIAVRGEADAGEVGEPDILQIMGKMVKQRQESARAYEEGGRLELAENHRDLALFNLAIDSKLRGCDLVRMKVADVMASGQIKERASVLQSKTQKPVRFEISEGTRSSLARWMREPLMVGSEYLWPGRFHERLHISTRQYARIVRDWVTSIGLEASAYGTHSMRRTKVTQIYKKTGNLRAVQLLLGHTKMDSTVRYLGVDIEDALELAEHTEI